MYDSSLLPEMPQTHRQIPNHRTRARTKNMALQTMPINIQNNRGGVMVQVTQETLAPKIRTTYGKSQYNYVKGNRQRIELHRGCPHQHEYCYEPNINQDFPIPRILRNYVEILDMNFLCRKDPLETIQHLGKIKVNHKVVFYEAVCGLDFRFMTQEIAHALHKARFVNMRMAWDGPFADQYKIKDALACLWKAGYKPHELSLFMIVNWKIPIDECHRKLDLMKVWNTKVCDCCYDGGYKHATPTLWTANQLRQFRAECRRHNHLVLFKIDPTIKPTRPVIYVEWRMKK